DDHTATEQSRARPAPTGSSSRVRVYALKEDLQARGIAHDSLPASIEPITYAEFVALVCEHKKSVSWF
ncbi:MAG: sulfurtransferase complex subunit TusB, partial [Pseudohongiellaceae bacterium]